jgi:hypothetical protein
MTRPGKSGREEIHRDYGRWYLPDTPEKRVAGNLIPHSDGKTGWSIWCRSGRRVAPRDLH